MSPRRLLREGRLVEPAEIVARLDAVTLDDVTAAGARMLAGPRGRRQRRRQARQGGVSASTP